jgi:hypothetical protein
MQSIRAVLFNKGGIFFRLSISCFCQGDCRKNQLTREEEYKQGFEIASFKESQNPAIT